MLVITASKVWSVTILLWAFLHCFIKILIHLYYILYYFLCAFLSSQKRIQVTFTSFCFWRNYYGLVAFQRPCVTFPLGSTRSLSQRTSSNSQTTLRRFAGRLMYGGSCMTVVCSCCCPSSSHSTKCGPSVKWGSSLWRVSLSERGVLRG